MEGESIKTFLNLCKIFEMKIKLDREKGETTSPEIFENYESYAKKIDTYYNDNFQKELKNLISPESTMEKEEERLKKLISILEERLERRNSLSSDFYQTTGKYIKGLQLIVSDSELNNKKNRLSFITRYLDTVKEIDDINENIDKLKKELEEEKEKKEAYTSKNKIMEDELYSEFITNVNKDEYYRDIEEENIINILSDVSGKARESKETLDITKESVNSLISSGIDDEYESYVEEANKTYSLWKEREIILSIYKLVIGFEEEFSDLLTKREKINSLLSEREKSSLDKVDILLSFEDVMLKQSKILKEEKEILENISNYTSRINFKEERLKELKEVVKEPEVLAILKEYNITDIYDIIDEDSGNDPINVLDITSDNLQDSVVTYEYNPYRIISVEDYPKTLNVGLARVKASSVRDKVNKKLNPTVSIETRETISNELPSWGAEDSNIAVNTPSFNSSLENIPVWEEEKHGESLPMWEVNDGQEELPTWTDVSNSSEEKNDSVMMEGNPNNEENGSFWIPVSDAKLETSEFPDINIPVPNDNLNSGVDNFGFPEAEGDK